MATNEISILGSGTLPDTSGDVFMQPYSIFDAGSPPLDPLVFVFNDSGNKDGLRGSFIVPQNYVGTASVRVFWTANAVANDIVFDLSYLVATEGDDMGGTATSTDDTVTDTKNGTAYDLQIAEFGSVTSGDFAAGKLVTFELFRDGANVADDLGQAACVFDVVFRYSDT